MGRKIPLHSFALSPGFISTCREHRQNGQWLREVYPRASTSFPQAAHIKPLSFFENLFVSIFAPSVLISLLGEYYTCDFIAY